MSVSHEILLYMQNNIIPAYASFDKAHDLQHVDRVIQNSLSIALSYEINLNMVYVIAAYHDIGLKNGRDNHEKSSAVFLLSDTKLRDWFSEEEITTMAEAVEDHRASSDYEPRSIYGKIISEADRDIEYVTILTRCIQYGLKNYPQYDIEQHFTRIYEHIKDKYGENGYLKLWLNTEKNEKQLKEIRKILRSKDRIRADFKRIYDACTQ